MDIGATLTNREARTILRRLNTISRLTDDRRVKEQCRLIACTINRAGRRVDRRATNEPKLF